MGKNAKYRKGEFLLLSFILSILITILVYFTGGTNKVYPNFMYIPIVIVASTNGKKLGVFHAVFGGLLIGPFMPLVVSPHTPQSFHNWMLRLVIYSIIALVIGYFADYYKKEYEKNIHNEKELIDSHLSTIFALVKLSESRDREAGTHIERVTELCKFLTTKMGENYKFKDEINEEYINTIYKSSSLHDVGKVGIPDYILLKPGKLTEEEFETIKQHTLIGSDNLLEVYKQYPNNKVLKLGIDIAQYHHEKWDGSGYPHGLREEEIPLAARIMAIVDVYDALRSKRVYKEAYSHEESIQILKDGRGTHFDPFILDVFLNHATEIKLLFDDITLKYE